MISYKYSVYVHINKINNKIYVGMTSREPLKRWQNGKSYQSYFQNAINKYGWDNFDHEVVASNLTEHEAKNFEKLLIQKLQTYIREKGYNRTLGGDGISGYNFSEETRQKMSESRKGKSHPYMQGEKHHFFNKKGVLSCRYGASHSEETRQKMRELKLGKKQSKEHIQKVADSHRGEKSPLARSVIQLDVNNNFICRFVTVSEAGEKTNTDISGIVKCCKQKYKTAGGYKWVYSEDYDKENPRLEIIIEY